MKKEAKTGLIILGVAGAATAIVMKVTATPSGVAECYGYCVDVDSGLGIEGVAVSLSGSNNYTTHSDSSGYFKLSNVKAGSYTLSLRRLNEYEEVTVPIQMASGQSIDLGSISLVPITPPEAPGSFQGVVWDAKTWDAIVGRYVDIDGYVSSEPTDGGGHFLIENVPPGQYFTLRVEGYEPYSVS